MHAHRSVGLEAVSGTKLDALVVGGGIAGACIALEAARRGLTVGLVERADYGGGATANCFKIVHGGLRYLQRLDFRRARASTVERSLWLRAAPHLVEPLPFLVPTYRGRFPSRTALAAGLAANEALSRDRNRGLPPDRAIPSGRVLSRRQCIALEPSIESPTLTGGVLFQDALMYSPERLTLEVVEAARAAGAVTANHVELVAADRRDGGVVGARLRDVITGDEARVSTRWLINATGSSAPAVAARLTARPHAVRQAYSVAVSFVTRLPAHEVAFTVSSGGPDGVRNRGGKARQLFVVPWRGQTMVGTAHLEYNGDPAAFRPEPEHTEHFLDEIAAAHPGLSLTRDDVALVHAGLLPVAAGSPGADSRLLDRHRIVDHAGVGCARALSVVTVKFTTARTVAREVVERIAPVGRSRRELADRVLPLPGGAVESMERLRTDARARYGTLVPEDVLEHLVRTYGARYEAVLDQRHHLPAWDERVEPTAPVIRAQLTYGARAEHARTAADLLWRRTELGPRGLVTDGAVQMAEEALAGTRRPDGSRSVNV